MQTEQTTRVTPPSLPSPFLPPHSLNKKSCLETCLLPHNASLSPVYRCLTGLPQLSSQKMFACNEGILTGRKQFTPYTFGDYHSNRYPLTPLRDIRINIPLPTIYKLCLTLFALSKETSKQIGSSFSRCEQR